MMFFEPLMLFSTENALDFQPSITGLAIFWLGVIIMALVVEALTTDLVSLWFAPGALVAMILAVFEVHVVIQIVACLVVSIALMILAKTVFKKYLHKRTDKVDTSVSALVGRVAMVDEEINNQTNRGVVKINGQLWRASMEDPQEIAPKDTKVEIIRVQGTELICRRLP